MKRILLYLGLFSLVAGQEGKMETLDEPQETSENKKSIFRPLEVTSHNYGVFKVGYFYQYQNIAPTLNLSTNSNYYKNYHGAYFGIERGWIGGYKNMFMVGGYLDGGAGETFFLSLGAKFGMRLFNGWLIPHLGIGYQIESLEFPNDNEHKQYNAHNFSVSTGAFVNIAKNFGMDLSIRSGTPLKVIETSSIKNRDSINHFSVMLSFTFYDFGI